MYVKTPGPSGLSVLSVTQHSPLEAGAGTLKASQGQSPEAWVGCRTSGFPGLWLLPPGGHVLTTHWALVRALQGPVRGGPQEHPPSGVSLLQLMPGPGWPQTVPLFPVGTMGEDTTLMFLAQGPTLTWSLQAQSEAGRAGWVPV